MTETWIHIWSLSLVLAGAETLHGIARMIFLVPRLGKRRATQLSIISGSLLAFLVCWFMVPGIGLREPGPLLGVGLFLALFMAAFDIGLGRTAMGRTYPDLLTDFDPRTGNYLSLGLALLLLFPWLVMPLRTPR